MIIIIITDESSENAEDCREEQQGVQVGNEQQKENDRERERKRREN